MADLYLDEDVSHALKPLLESAGHTVTTTRQQQREGSSDGDQLLHAAGSARIVVTHNKKDFELLHDAWMRWTAAWNLNHRHHGIVIISQLMPPQDNAVAIDALLSGHLRLDARLLGFDVATKRWTLYDLPTREYRQFP